MGCGVLISGLPLHAAVADAGVGNVPGRAEDTSIQSFTVKGVVRELRPDDQTLLVAHEPILGYMDAMTMPFRVKEAKFPHELQAGDQIAFQLHVTQQESWIDHISKLGHSPEGETKAAAAPVKPLPSKPRHPLLDCQFTNELGQAVTLGDFRGQALAITFFFTRCPIPDYCPRLSRNFEEASEKLQALPNAPTNWHFLSFSFDPAFDTPARLKAYAEGYHYDPRHWSLLTGAPDKIAELAAQSDVKFQADNGFFNHNFRTLIIDATGHLQMSFPIGGNLSGAIVSEILRAAAVTDAPGFAAAQTAKPPLAAPSRMPAVPDK